MTEEHEVQQRLAEFIGRETEYWDFWGAIRIVKNGKILWETSRGYACAEFGVKNNMSTRFTIASVSKQFTAFAVMRLYDRGLLSLDADANTYLPEDMQIPAGITVHHLLAHTSGLYNFYNFGDDFYIGEDRLPYDRKLYLVRVNQNIHIELYCIGPNTFIRRCEEQSYTFNLLPEGSDKPAVWGYELISKAFI